MQRARCDQVLHFLERVRQKALAKHTKVGQQETSTFRSPKGLRTRAHRVLEEGWRTPPQRVVGEGLQTRAGKVVEGLWTQAVRVVD